MTATDRRQLLLAFAAFSLVQVAYWFALVPLLFSLPPIGNTLPVDQVQVVTLERPEFALIASAPRKTIALRDHQCCGPGYRAFILTVQLDAVPSDGLAYASSMGADNIQVYINGSLVRGDGRMTLPDITYHNNLRRITHFPSGLLRVGQNEIVNIMVRDFNPWFDIYRPLIGPYTALRADLARRSFMLIEYTIISITTGVILAILALVVSLRPEQRQIGLWMAGLLTLWTLRTLYYSWADTPLHGADRLSYYFVLTTALPWAWVNVINEWAGGAWKWLRPASAAAFVGCALVIVYALQTGEAEAAYARSVLIVNLLGIACAITAAVRLALHLWRSPGDRPWERAVLLLCISLLGVECAQELFRGISNGQSQTSQPLLMIVFALAFARGNARLLQLATEFGNMLASRLQLREAELAEAHRRETDLVRRETLAVERRRLMLDMHDGVVGQLVGIQHAARGNKLSGLEIADDLAAVVDELRLVIDSLDGTGTNFSNALACYRSRIEPRLNAIGIKSRWHNELPLDEADCDPGATMNALRILQEAITNAIKYAETARLDVYCGLNPDQPQRITLSIRDYGSGLDPGAPMGRGISNMRARARAVGATFEVFSCDPGTLLRLDLPCAGVPK